MYQALMDLGMGSSNSETQSLEEEVDSYLAVPSRDDWDSIAFWEVCYIVDLINTHLQYIIFRLIKITFQLYSSLQWTYFQFKLPQFLMKGYSPLARRLLQQEEIPSALTLLRLFSC